MNIIDEIILRHLGFAPVKSDLELTIQKDAELANAGKSAAERTELFKRYGKLKNAQLKNQGAAI